MKQYLLPISLVLLIVMVFAGLFTTMWGFSVYNTEASLKNQYEMKVKDNQNEFDNMWKQIAQSTQIADKNKDGLKEILSDWAKGNTPADGGKVMLWIKQAVPNTDGVSKLYEVVMNVMMGKRDGFTMRQKELVSIAEVYNRNLVVEPRGMILGFFGFKHIDPLIVTSTRTDNAFQSGKDDDISLSPK